MTDYKVTFDNDPEGIKAMAIFVAQLVREQVTFRVRRDVHEYEVTLTGGF